MECQFASSLGYANNAAFKSLCVDLDKDPRPLIYVNSPYAYFNITGNFTFKNLRFSGINAFAKSPNPTYDLNTYPIKLCDIDKEPTGADGTIKLKKYSYKDFFKLPHKCQDLEYTGSYVPSSLNSTTKCS
jgi:hypothetical protein